VSKVLRSHLKPEFDATDSPETSFSPEILSELWC
jgi:hypothetical protein